MGVGARVNGGAPSGGGRNPGARNDGGRNGRCPGAHHPAPVHPWRCRPALVPMLQAAGAVGVDGRHPPHRVDGGLPRGHPGPERVVRARSAGTGRRWLPGWLRGRVRPRVPPVRYTRSHVRAAALAGFLRSERSCRLHAAGARCSCWWATAAATPLQSIGTALHTTRARTASSSLSALLRRRGSALCSTSRQVEVLPGPPESHSCCREAAEASRWSPRELWPVTPTLTLITAAQLCAQVDGARAASCIGSAGGPFCLRRA